MPCGDVFMNMTQAIRIGKRDRLQQDGVDDREDGGVGADAERQRGHGGQGEARALAEHAERVPEIFQKRFHVVLPEPYHTVLSLDGAS